MDGFDKILGGDKLKDDLVVRKYISSLKLCLLFGHPCRIQAFFFEYLFGLWVFGRGIGDQLV